MRTAKVYVCGKEAGLLTELIPAMEYGFNYFEGYSGLPVSLTMPVRREAYSFKNFPPFFDGLLPEGHQLEGLMKLGKVGRNDLFGQLMMVGNDMVGAITVKEIREGEA